MKTRLSKQRTRLTRDREKRAGKEKTKASRTGGLLQHPAWRVLIMLAAWLISVALVYSELFSKMAAADYFGIILNMGPAVFLFLCLLGCALFLDVVNPAVLRSTKLLFLLAVLVLSSAALSGLLLYVGRELNLDDLIIVFFLPVTVVSMVCVLLLDPYTATVAGLWTGLVVALMLPFPLEVLLMSMIGIAVSVWMVRGVRTRTKVVRAGIVTGVAQAACIMGFAFYNGHVVTPPVAIGMAAASVAGGLMVAIITLLILPFLEMSFGLTSDLALFDLSDLGHPLLQRLALEAPGTYHHSLVVANLAQAAAEEIGANGLLTRVGAYYHDIGKLVKPHFFAENMRLQDNPHDELPPSMSTLVITAHVKEGLSLAMLHKLPAPIRDMIQEHHGTSVLSCFHHKARQQMELGFARNGDRGRVADGDFRYSGPKPHSREATILSLADPVEAASRSLERIAPANIESLVDDIVEQRFEDGQLSNSALSMQELTSVKRSFVHTLCNMLHARVSYPKNDEDKDQQNSAELQGKQPDSSANNETDAGPRSEG